VVGRGCHLGRGGVKIDDAEVSAIAEALQIVQEKITIGNTVSRSASAVVVYSNSEAALIRIRDFRSGSRFQVGLMVRVRLSLDKNDEADWRAGHLALGRNSARTRGSAGQRASRFCSQASHKTQILLRIPVSSIQALLFPSERFHSSDFIRKSSEREITLQAIMKML
jgi:hypothetical protein